MVTKALQADKQPSFRAFWVLGALLFLGVWGLRLATLHPAFHPDDSPEITAAMSGLGIAHPPGYPLPTLLGRLASLGLPGAPAFATNALAALGSALAVVLALCLLRPRGPWLLVAALGLATLPQLWFQGQSSKGGLYTLNICLTLGAWLAMQSPRRLALGWLLIGLGLANHYMSLALFLPGLAYLSWTARPGLKAQAKLWAFAIPGLALYLYLPIRASFEPAMNWGDPQTWDRFWDVILRRMYAGAESGQDLDNALHLGRHFLSLWSGQWHWVGLALLGLGIAPLWKQQRVLLLTLALHLGVVLAYNHPPKHAPWVINAFFLPTFVLGAALLLQGAQRAQAWLPQNAAPWLPWALAALFVGLTPQRFARNDYSQDHLLRDYAKDLGLIPVRHGILLAAGGNDAFPVWYQQQLLGQRRDLLLIDVPLIGDWYLEQLPGLNPLWKTKDEVVQGLLAAPPRPLYYSSHNPGDRGIPLGLVSLVPAPGQALALSAQGLLDPWKAVRLRWVADGRTPIDGNREELLAYYPDSAAALKRFGAAQNALPLAQAAERLEGILRRASAAALR